MFLSYSDRILLIQISNGNSDYSQFGGYLLFLLQHHFNDRSLNGSRTVNHTVAFLCQNTISKPFCSLFSTWLSCVKTWIKCLTLWFTWRIQLNTIYLNWKIAKTKIKKITRKSLAKTVVFFKKMLFFKSKDYYCKHIYR